MKDRSADVRLKAAYALIDILIPSVDMALRVRLGDKKLGMATGIWRSVS